MRNKNGNQGMKMNDVFTCLNKRCNVNHSGGPYLKLRIITRVLIVMREVGVALAMRRDGTYMQMRLKKKSFHSCPFISFGTKICPNLVSLNICSIPLS